MACSQEQVGGERTGGGERSTLDADAAPALRIEGAANATPRQASPATADAFCAFCAMMWSSCADSDAIAAWRGRATACWGGGLTLSDDAVAAKAAKMSP